MAKISNRKEKAITVESLSTENLFKQLDQVKKKHRHKIVKELNKRGQVVEQVATA